VGPSAVLGIIRDVARAVASRGEGFAERLLGYAWVLFVAEAMGVARRLKDGSFRFYRGRARLAEYIKRLTGAGHAS